MDQLDEEKASPSSRTKAVASAAFDEFEGGLHRNLKARHVQMIAIGGTIGTGLFLGSGGALAVGGPLGILLGYMVMGLTCYSMMVALGEMCTFIPVAGAFTHYSSRFVDPALGFALGWNFWFSTMMTLPSEITAAVVVIQYWPAVADINPGVWIAVLLVSACAFNVLGVKWYGESEFWFSIIKLVTIIGLIFTGIIITAGGAPSHEPIGFRYWKSPGPFLQLDGIPGRKGRFLAFWKTLIKASFSYLGTEVVALSAAEAENPRRNIPKAIKRVFWRILIFYVIGVFVIGLIVSPTNEELLNGTGTAASPWVIAIKASGIKALPSIVNAVILTSAFSAASSDLYAGSRVLYGMAVDGKAPAVFLKCTKNGLPIYSLLIASLFGLLAFMTLSHDGTTVFNWLSDLSSITGLITWSCILTAYLRFYYGCKHQGIDRSEFAFRAPLQPYFSYFGLVVCFLVVFFDGFTLFLRGNWNTSSFFVDYITLLIFPLTFVFWKLFRRTSFVRLDSMDILSGQRQLQWMADEEELKHPEPISLWGRVWNWAM